MTSVSHKKRKNIYILLIILIVLLGAYFGVLKYNKYLAEKENSEAIAVTSIDTDTITKLEYTSAGENYSFVKADDVWQWEQDATLPITQSYIDNIISSACALNAERILENNLDNKATYGLDNPAYTVKLTLEDGTQTIIYIGDQNTTTSVYYSYIEGDENIYTISDSLVSTLTNTLSQMITYEDIPTMDSTNITDIKYSDSDTSLDFDYYSDGNEQSDYSDSFTWFLNENGSLTPADSTQMSTLLTNISSLTFASLADYSVTDEELSNYGLDSPQAVLNVTYTTTDDKSNTEKNNAFTLNIGNTDESGNYYVKVEGMSGVYTIAADSVGNFLNLNSLGFTNKNAFNVLKESLDSIAINIDGESWDIVVNKETSKDDDGNDQIEYTYTVNGTQIKSDTFDTMYSLMQNLTAESVIDDETDSTGDPYMTIVFNRNTENLKTVEIDISKYNSSFYRADIEGSNSLLLNIQDISELVNNIKSLLNN